MTKATMRPPAVTAAIEVSIGAPYVIGHDWPWLITAIVAPLAASAGSTDGGPRRVDGRTVPPKPHLLDGKADPRRTVGKMRR